ncbi:MAG: methylmalonyl-CoA mutase family protein, partial [Thermoanaerobaculia bacterium]|nr:methylmalonyl-CoA mutase family protein [Thermoanaerobaculia bacterium]
ERGLEAEEALSEALASELLNGSDIWLGAGTEAGRRAALWDGWRQRGEASDRAVTIHLGIDPLGALAARGAVPRPLAELVDEAVHTAARAADRAAARAADRAADHRAGSTTLTISTVAYQEAGADLATELGFALAALVDYLSSARAAGLETAQILPQVAWRFAVGCQVFPEIAKLRAARLLWRAICGAAGLERVPPLALHVVGSRRTYALREPQINLLRASQQGVIATCGGATAVSLPPYDAVGRTPSERGRRLARAIPLVLEHEGRLGRVADPAAGAYVVEAATRRLAEAAWELAQEVERRGGMARELLSGAAGERVEAAWRERRRTYEAKRAGLTGVTDYVDDGARVLPAGERVELSVDETEEEEVCGERIERFRLRRDAEPYETDGAESGGTA